ncbi:MAG: FAD-dependent monooxygenase [Nitrosomonas sp.]|nr:FAD-dependent monooxygenase [Nitrosomonas sp.]
MHNLVIIGSGPAGCAAAISARIKGLSVVLLDIPKFARLLPGETLHPGAEPLLRHLGVWAAIEACSYHRHTGLWRVDLQGSRNFTPYGSDGNGPWRGFQVNRVEFNKILRQRAINAGVFWIEVSKLKRALHDKDGWILESIANERINAITLMDATGRSAWLAAQLGVAVERYGETQRVQFGWSNIDNDETDGNPVFTTLSHGWKWSAPISETRMAWVKQYRGEDNIGIDVTPRIHSLCAGPGWFLLGDAAFMTTPAAGNGILRALMSGMYSIHIYAAMRNTWISEEQGAKFYCSWMRKLWQSTILATERGFLTPNQ